MSIYEVVWEQNDQLTRLASAPRIELNECTLFLQYLENRIEMSGGALKIGRDPDCGLIIEAPQASRFHCEIRKKGSKFALIDNSTNGTYILQNNVELYFHQEEAPLHNTGTISLGQSVHSNKEHLLQFLVESGKPHQPG